MTAIRIIDDHLELANIGSNTHAQIDTHIAAADNYVKRDGSLALTADWDIGDTRKILADEIRARDAAGLKLYDDGGNGIFVEDGGNVGINNPNPSSKLHIIENNIDAHYSYGIAQRITYNKTSNYQQTSSYVETLQTVGVGDRYSWDVTTQSQAIGHRGGGTSVKLLALDIRNGVGDNGTIENSIGLRIASPYEYVSVVGTNPTGAITMLYGIIIEPKTPAGTNLSITYNYGIFIKSPTTGNGTINVTNDYSVYAPDSVQKAYFAGDIGIGTAFPTAKVDINSDIIRLRTAKTPASGGAGNTGDICFDSNYGYRCVSTNVWKRWTLTGGY